MMMMMMTRGTELGTWKMGVTSYAPVARDDNNNNDDHDDDDDDMPLGRHGRDGVDEKYENSRLFLNRFVIYTH